MSVAALSWAFDQKLPPNQKVVLLALADCENGQSLVCNPGQEYLAEKASISIRTLRTMLEKLEARKLISRTRHSTNGGRATDSYTLHRDGSTQPADLAGSEQPANLAGSATGKKSTRNRQTVAGTKEPEVNQKKDARVREGHQLFDLFWSIYPRQSQRDAAFQAWRVVRAQHPGDSITNDILIAAQAYAAACAPLIAAERVPGEVTNFIPLPAKWLTSGQWRDDEPHPPTAPRGSRPDAPAPAPKPVPPQLQEYYDEQRAQRESESATS